MFKLIPPLDIQSLVQKNLGINLKLKLGLYYIIEKETTRTIILTNKLIASEINQIHDILSFGIPILKLIGNKIQLLPPILECIDENYPSVQFDLDKEKEISYGRNVKINASNMFCFVVSNTTQAKISFGEVKNNIFIPLIDLGWYLRSGN